MAARAIQSGTISFGLVSIPVKFFTAASSEQVRFNMLHKACGSRLKQQMVCPKDGEVVGRSDTVRGYEFERDQFVQFNDEEFSALETSKDSSIEIVEFVPLAEFDLLYVEKSYYLGPDKGGDKAYRLLSESMTRANTVAVGHFAGRGKEQLVVIRPYRDGLLYHQLYFQDEVRSFEEVDTGATFQFADVERDLAMRLIEQLSRPSFDYSKYRDSFRDRVLQAVEQKVQGQKLVFSPEAPRAQIIDLFEALKQSLKDVGAEKPIGPKKAEVEPEATPRKAKKRARA